MAYSKTIPKYFRYDYVNRLKINNSWSGAQFVGHENVSTVKSGSAVPGFRGLIATSRDATSAYSIDVVDIKRAVQDHLHGVWTDNTTQSVPLNRYEYLVRGFVNGASLLAKPSHLPIVNTPVDSLALARLLSRIRDDQQQFAGLTFLGEGMEALRMIARPGAAIRDGLIKYADRYSDAVGRLYRKPKKSRRAAQRELVDIATGTWFEVSFGWKPLLSDAESAAIALARLLKHDNRVARVQGFANAERSETYDPVTQNGNRPTQCFQYVQKTTEYSCKYVAGMAMELVADSGSLQRATELFGFRPSEFVPTLWELIPNSWLVDYVSNVGQVLEAAVTDTSRVAWATKTTRQVTSFRSNAAWSGEPFIGSEWFGDWLVNRPHEVEVVRTTIARTSALPLGIPPLAWKSPPERFQQVGNVIGAALSRINSLPVPARFRGR